MASFLDAIDESKYFGFCSKQPMYSTDFEILSETLGAGGMRPLEILDLSGGSVGSEGHAAYPTSWLGLALPSFARAAQQQAFPPNLVKLYLSSTGVDDFGLLALIQAAAGPGVLATLRKLDLSQNDIRGNNWPGRISQACFPSLKMLNLEGNEIREDGIVAMAKAVCKPGVLVLLERLGLKNNPFRTKGLKAWTKALASGTLPSLKQLTSIVNPGDPGFAQCKEQAVRDLKDAMMHRNIAPRLEITRFKYSGRRWHSVWTSSLEFPSSHEFVFDEPWDSTTQDN